MRKRTAAIGSAVMFIVGPGLVIGVVPWLLTRWQFRDPTPYWAIFRVLGVLLILAGLVVLIQAFARFVTEGFGTPLPAAPPTHLVVGGIYRWVRNPIYVAALAVIKARPCRSASSDRWCTRRAVPAWWPRMRPRPPTPTPPR